jgi:DNA-binding NarL/FixJ family response regulator
MQPWSERISMQGRRRTTVLLMDKDPFTREHLKKMLEARDFEILGQANNSDEAVHLCSRLRPDVAVLDTSREHPMIVSVSVAPRSDSVEAARRIAKVCPATRIIVIAPNSDVTHVGSGLAAGVSGFVLKTRVADSLADAIRAVTQGAIVLGAGITVPARAA